MDLLASTPLRSVQQRYRPVRRRVYAEKHIGGGIAEEESTAMALNFEDVADTIGNSPEIARESFGAPTS